MRRRPRVDLGQAKGEPSRDNQSTRDEEIRERKRKRWDRVNKHRPAEENPFLAAIKPTHDNYGDPNESAEQLRARLERLEFGNYPGYFNYRNKAATSSSTNDSSKEPSNQSTSKPDNEKQPSLGSGLEDPRLRLMKGEWFKGKRVLDIGCNRGHVTYAIAKLFSPTFILGIDIDPKMISMANRDLHHHVEEEIIKSNIEYRIKRAQSELSTVDNNRQEQAGGDRAEKPAADQYKEGGSHFPLSSYVTKGPLAVSISSCLSSSGGQNSESNCDTTTPKTSTASEEQQQQRGEDELRGSDEGQARAPSPNQLENSCPTFPNNILFVEHNYVPSRDWLGDKQRPHFDTIVCLSVTKWIHLNYGDEGVKRFFKRIQRHLHESGLLVLEAQPFDNYHRKRKLSERLRENFESIKFKPEQFDEFLLSPEGGFRQILFSTTTEHECAGFKRPMKVFLK